MSPSGSGLNFTENLQRVLMTAGPSLSSFIVINGQAAGRQMSRYMNFVYYRNIHLNGMYEQLQDTL